VVRCGVVESKNQKVDGGCSVKLVEFTISLPVESALELDAIARKINRKIEDVASLLLANAIRQRVQEMDGERD
jgi:hypothetical protein